MAYLEDELGRMLTDQDGDPLLDEGGWTSIWRKVTRSLRVKRFRLPKKKR